MKTLKKKCVPDDTNKKWSVISVPTLEGEARKYRRSVCAGVGLCWFGRGLVWGEGPGSQGWSASSSASGDLEQVPELLCEMQTPPSEEDVVKQGLVHVTRGPSLEVTRGAGGALGVVAGELAGHFLFRFHFSTCTEKARRLSGCPLPSPGLSSSPGKWRY